MCAFLGHTVTFSDHFNILKVHTHNILVQSLNVPIMDQLIFYLFFFFLSFSTSFFLSRSLSFPFLHEKLSLCPVILCSSLLSFGQTPILASPLSLTASPSLPPTKSLPVHVQVMNDIPTLTTYTYNTKTAPFFIPNNVFFPSSFLNGLHLFIHNMA